MPTNDIQVSLVHAGTVLHTEDTGVGQETGGPYPYTGAFTDVDVTTPPLPITPPGSIAYPITVTPKASYSAWGARFAPATVVDPQRTEGEPLETADPEGNIWESGPWGFTTAQSFVHRSTNDGQEYHLVSATGLRPDAPPGGGDTDIAFDDQGNVYFADLEGLEQIGVSVSRDNGMTWTKNVAAYSSPGTTGATDPVGGIVWQNSGSLPGPLQPLAGDAICAKLRFDPVKRNLYYACNEGDHIRITVGHVDPGQRTGIVYTNYDGPATPGGGDVLGLFPTLTTDATGNVYVAWIDKTNSALYYAFSSDHGQRWSAPVRVSTGDAATNEFDWAQAGVAGRVALAWYGTAKTDPAGSDGMPSALADQGAATAYPWYGYAALVTGANTKAPKVMQTRFTEKPMHYGNICNSGLGCTTNPTADRQMADFFGFSLTQNGGLRVVFNDTTNELDGAGLFATRQLAGPTVKGTTLAGSAAKDPVSDATGDAQYPHYSPAGVGANLPQLDLKSLKVSSPASSTLRFTMTVADLSQLTPPAGKTTPVWLVRFQALGPLATEPQDVYHVYYAYMQKTAGALPRFYAGVATCQTTTPTNCKILQYRGEKAADGTVNGNTITIDVGVKTGFGTPIDATKLYNVTAFTFGRNDPVDDLYADVDATQPFDYTLGSVR